MPTPGAKLTDLPELSAYVLAHAAGLTWGVFVNPVIFRSLVAHGYSDHILLAAIAHSIAVSVVVLLIFLVLRKAMTGSGAPAAPADLQASPSGFTNGRELFAYVLAHASRYRLGRYRQPWIFRSLIEQGYRNLMLLRRYEFNIAVAVAVLLIFLYSCARFWPGSEGPRRPMARPMRSCLIRGSVAVILLTALWFFTSRWCSLFVDQFYTPRLATLQSTPLGWNGTWLQFRSRENGRRHGTGRLERTRIGAGGTDHGLPTDRTPTTGRSLP